MAHILVADDNRGFAELVRALLEDAGHSVVTAYSGLAALAAAEKERVDRQKDAVLPRRRARLQLAAERQVKPAEDTAEDDEPIRRE